MPQLNVYVPAELEQKIKIQAKREGKSVSAFVLEVVRSKIEPECWSKEFLATFGSMKGCISEAKDLPLQKRSALNSLDDES